jgi:hypothetical protein
MLDKELGHDGVARLADEHCELQRARKHSEILGVGRDHGRAMSRRRQRDQCIVLKLAPLVRFPILAKKTSVSTNAEAG